MLACQAYELLQKAELPESTRLQLIGTLDCDHTVYTILQSVHLSKTEALKLVDKLCIEGPRCLVYAIKLDKTGRYDDLLIPRLLRFDPEPIIQFDEYTRPPAIQHIDPPTTWHAQARVARLEANSFWWRQLDELILEDPISSLTLYSKTRDQRFFDVAVKASETAYWLLPFAANQELVSRCINSIAKSPVYSGLAIVRFEGRKGFFSERMQKLMQSVQRNSDISAYVYYALKDKPDCLLDADIMALFEAASKPTRCKCRNPEEK